MPTDTTSTAPSTTPPTGSTNTQGLAPWAGDYITGYLGKAQALADEDYQLYEGDLYTGASDLQTNAFTGIGALTAPTELKTAATDVGNLADKYGNLSYTPTQFTDTYTAPAAFNPVEAASLFTDLPDYTGAGFSDTYFTAPGAYNPQTNFGPGFITPEMYQKVGGSFINAGIAQQYMNPYLEQALNPVLREIQRQSIINLNPQLAKLTQAGGYGGSREALLRSESQRNLLDQIAKTTGEGYSTAYNKAAEQFNKEQEQKVNEAQFLAKQRAEFAENTAKYGLEIAKAIEQSKQYGATQAMTSAQEKAKYGLEAERAAEQARQFAEEQRRKEAERELEAQRIAEESRKAKAELEAKAAENEARYALEASKGTAEEEQFAAKYGLDALTSQISAEEKAAALAKDAYTTEADVLKRQLDAGAIKRGIEQEEDKAKYEEFERQRDYDYKQLEWLRNMISGLPVSSIANSPGELSGIASVLASLGGIDKLLTDYAGTDLEDMLRAIKGLFD